MSGVSGLLATDFVSGLAVGLVGGLTSGLETRQAPPRLRRALERVAFRFHFDGLGAWKTPHLRIAANSLFSANCGE